MAKAKKKESFIHLLAKSTLIFSVQMFLICTFIALGIAITAEITNDEYWYWGVGGRIQSIMLLLALGSFITALVSFITVAVTAVTKS